LGAILFKIWKTDSKKKGPVVLDRNQGLVSKKALTGTTESSKVRARKVVLERGRTCRHSKIEQTLAHRRQAGLTKSQDRYKLSGFGEKLKGA
jgi:hypothetical protein